MHAPRPRMTLHWIGIGSHYARALSLWWNSHELGCTSGSSSSYFGEPRAGTAMQVANRFFARRNSEGVTSCLSSADWLTVTVRQTSGREGVTCSTFSKACQTSIHQSRSFKNSIYSKFSSQRSFFSSSSSIISFGLLRLMETDGI